MKKLVTLSAICCCAVLLLVIAGCSDSGAKKNNYAEVLNEKLVSFTDCADDFSAVLEEIAGSPSAPSDKQLVKAYDSLGRLEKACNALSGIQSPAEYVDAQEKLNQAVADYNAAFEKCRALLDFFRSYDELFHSFGNPEQGSAEMEKQERALYDDFAQAMKNATESFRTACEELEKVKQE